MSGTDDASKSFDEAKKSFEEAHQTFKSVTKDASHSIVSTASSIASAVSASYAVALDYLDHAQQYVDTGIAHYKAAEDMAVQGVKDALAFTAANPTASYTAAGTIAVLSLPVTRRILWRSTFGRFTNPESVVKSSAEEVESLKGRLNDFGTEVQKLEERLKLAEEEWKRGYQKLRATRLELQRLETSVARNERTATGIVHKLRLYKNVDSSLPVRGEAAAQAAALKSLRSRITRGVNRIANFDI